jgi:hypothetical protein
MTQTFGQLPKRNPPRANRAKASTSPDGAIAVFLIFGLSLVPRLWILGFWIFSYGIGDAYSSWIIPAVGLIVAPWTTLLYAWMWAIGSDAVHGWEWLAVAVGVLLDLSFLGAIRRWLV